MSEGTLYLKYRPRQLKGIVGQNVLVKSLAKAAKQEKFSHAYLFSGVYGTGKTSAARILATLLTCPDRKPGSVTVCGVCRSCQAIHVGHCVDVFELDGGSNGGVEEVRKLKETAYYSPNNLKRKVYIIDEAHKLSEAANSALLKIVEEPPEHLVFILCTTHPHKILPTIISRCQRYNFRKIPVEPMSERIVLVAEKEGITLESGVAQRISRMSKGSMRDAFSMLEQISVSTENNVTLASLNEYYGMPEDRLIHLLLKMVFEKNVSGALKVSNDLYLADVDPKVVLTEMSNVLSDIFHIKSCGTETDIVCCDPEERKFLGEMADKVSLGSIIRMIGSFNRIERDITVNLNERLVLDAALVNCTLIVSDEERQAKNGSARQPVESVA